MELHRYEQGRDRLRTDNRFCCLGVLCDIHARLHGESWSRVWGSYYYLDSHVTLPVAVFVWAGLKSGSGDRVTTPTRLPKFYADPRAVGLDRIIRPETVYTLARLNDAGVKFRHIAELIDEQL